MNDADDAKIGNLMTSFLRAVWALLIPEEAGWRISSMAWDDEREE